MSCILRKRGFKLFLIALLILSAAIITICFVNKSKPISLVDAYRIGYNLVHKSCDNPALSLITSVDESDAKPEQGKDGKRRCWNLIFADPSSLNKEYIVKIQDTKPEICPVKQNIDSTQFINMNDLVLTSEKAVSSAATNYGLLPGQSWAIGYHFVVVSFDGRIDFEVVGLRHDNKIMRVAFDGSTGNFIKVLMPNDG